MHTHTQECVRACTYAHADRDAQPRQKKTLNTFANYLLRILNPDNLKLKVAAPSHLRATRGMSSLTKACTAPPLDSG